MTPKEKAEIITGRFVALSPNTSLYFHKQCALITVDEILNSGDKNIWGIPAPSIYYWEQVKEEIKKL